MLLLLLPVLMSAAVLWTVLTYHVPSQPSAKAMMAGLMVGNLLLTLLRPRLGLVLLFFCLPLLDNLLFTAKLDDFSPILVLFFTFLSGWLLRRVLLADRERLKTPLDGPLLAFTLAGFGSGLITVLRYSQFYPFVGERFQFLTVNHLGENAANSVTWAFRALLVFVAGPAFFWAILHLVRRKEDVIQALAALAGGMALSILFGIYQTFGHLAVGNTPYFAALKRINASFMDPNALGCFFVLALPPISGLLGTTRRVSLRLAVLGILGGGFYVLCASGSRTGLIGLLTAGAIAGGLALLRLMRGNRRAYSRLFQAAFIAAVCLIAFFPTGRRSGGAGDSILARRLTGTLERVRRQGLIGMVKGDRGPMWQRAALVVGQFPVSGIGLGAFRTEIPNFIDRNAEEDLFRDNANNWYLQVSAEMGLIGLLLALIVLGVVLREAWRLALSRRLEGAQAAISRLLCGSVTAMTLMFIVGPHVIFVEVQLAFWGVIGLIFAQAYTLPLPTQERGAVSPAPPARRFLRLAGIGLVALFLGAQLVNSLTALSLPERQKTCGYDKSEGFYLQEGRIGGRIRWTRGEASAMVPAGRRRVRFQMAIAHPDAADDPVVVDILLDGRPAGREVFHQQGELHYVDLPLPAVETDEIEVRFRVNRTFVPREHFAGTPDQRVLGVMVGAFEFPDSSEATQ
ncbi:MAG TPA: O-antigen ligase family protein [Sumerlaeia bacterium]|nr:O-antigen ligase family protein [Sumerlaeia bacterium]